MPNNDRMSDDAEPIVENKRKPKMGDASQAPLIPSVSVDVITGLRPGSIPDLVAKKTDRKATRGLKKRAKLEMEETVGKVNRDEIVRMKQRIPGIKTMPASKAGKRKSRVLKDQIPLKTSAVKHPGEGYVRLQLEAENGNIKIVGVKRVEGPMIESRQVRSGLVYEVVRKGERVSMGQIPDAGERRGFPHPDPSPGQEGHSIVKDPIVSFMIRVPLKEFSAAKAKQLDVSLFRVKDAVRQKITDTVPLREQLSNELRDKARLKGIKMDQLDGDVVKQLRKALSRR
jgi:hypothetical protein